LLDENGVEVFSVSPALELVAADEGEVVALSEVDGRLGEAVKADDQSQIGAVFRACGPVERLDLL
jgi:hypothetical protein